MPRKNSVSFQKKIIDWDIYGWADANTHQPLELFEIVLLKDDKDRIFQGWWTGYKWDGIRIKKLNKIVNWRFLDIQEKEGKDD